jgi:hypothetical protein
MGWRSLRLAMLIAILVGGGAVAFTIFDGAKKAGTYWNRLLPNAMPAPESVQHTKTATPKSPDKSGIDDQLIRDMRKREKDREWLSSLKPGSSSCSRAASQVRNDEQDVKHDFWLKEQHRKLSKKIEPEPPLGPFVLTSLELPSDGQLVTSTKLASGTLAYGTPTKMNTDQTARVYARMGLNEIPVATLERAIPKEDNQKIETARTPISGKMKMTLTSADFQITPLDSEEQLVAGPDPTGWDWDIVPKRSGSLKLHLAAVVEINGGVRDYKSIDREITVKVDAIGTVEKIFKESWQWIATTVAGLIAAIWGFFKTRKKPAARAWETP